MAVFKTLAFLLLFVFFELHEASDTNQSFSFNGFSKSPDFALFRDSKLLGGSSTTIQLTDSVSQSEGRVLYKKPINLFGGKERNLSSLGSFSSHFSISSSSNSSVLSFVMVPSGLDLRLFDRKENNTSSSSSSGLGFLSKHKIVAIEFGLRNSVRFLVGGNNRAEFSKIRNFGDDESESNLQHFKRLNCWVDYEASSKRIEVRLSVSNDAKPIDPFVSYSLDLVKFWKNGRFLVGLVSMNGKSPKARFLYEWSFEMRYPSRIHSQPLDPNEGSKEEEEKSVEVKEGGRKRRKCIWGMFGALVLGAVCGTLGAVFALYVWTICGNRKRSIVVVPEECGNEKKSDNVDVVDHEEEGKK